MGRGQRHRIAKGIYSDDSGIAATVSIGTGKDRDQREKRYDFGTPLKTMKEWQDSTKVSLRQNTRRDIQRGTLAALIPIYLSKIEPLFTPKGYQSRVTDINCWLPGFGHRRPETIKTSEITDQLLAWRKERGPVTCNHRRDALSHFYHDRAGAALNKRHKLSGGPVEGAIRFAGPDPRPRAVALETIDRVIATIPDEPIRVRLTLLRWTGMRPSQQGRLERGHFDLDGRQKSVVVPRGKRGKLVRIPLVTKEAIQAARRFLELELFGEWTTVEANKALTVACPSLKVPRFTTYQIKHSVGSFLRSQRGVDLADVRDVYGHIDEATSAIYAPPVQAKQVQMFKLLKGRPNAKMRDGARRSRSSVG